MSENFEIETVYRHRLGGTDYYELNAEYGFTDLTYRITIGWFGIANFQVEPGYRNRGLGKAMLQRSLELAHELDARLIYAALISRESIEAFSSVFGEDAVHVIDRGTYSEAVSPDKYDARGTLYLPL